MPSSCANARRNSVGFKLGSGIYAVTKLSPKESNNLRQRSVFPEPTSPIILMKPSPLLRLNNNTFNASSWPLRGQKNPVCGVNPKGISLKLKYSKYINCILHLLFHLHCQIHLTDYFHGTQIAYYPAFHHLFS